MPRDASGTSRVGMFETITDPVTGKTYKPVSGRGDRVTYRASDGSEFTTTNRRLDAHTLSALADLPSHW